MTCLCARIDAIEADLARLASAVTALAELLDKRVRVVTARTETFGLNATTIEDVIRCVADEFGVRPSDIVGRARRPNIARARQVAMFLALSISDATLTRVGLWFGGRDHTTVLYARDAVSERLTEDAVFAARVARCVDALNSLPPMSPPRDSDGWHAASGQEPPSFSGTTLERSPRQPALTDAASEASR